MIRTPTPRYMDENPRWYMDENAWKLQEGYLVNLACKGRARYTHTPGPGFICMTLGDP